MIGNALFTITGTCKTEIRKCKRQDGQFCSKETRNKARIITFDYDISSDSQLQLKGNKSSCNEYYLHLKFALTFGSTGLENVKLRRMRASRALALFKMFLLRTRRPLSPLTLYSDSALRSQRNIFAL